MAWFFILVNFYFDIIVALMLGALLGYCLAKAAVHIQFLESYVIFNRILSYLFLISFTLLMCVTYVATKTDPDFSVAQRYQQAFQTIRSWGWKDDPLLARDGLESAVRMTTDWVAFPELVFYTKGAELYSVLTDGRKQRRRLRVDGEIQQVIFSPDGQYLAVKTPTALVIVNTDNDDRQIAYQMVWEGIAAHDVKMIFGGIQWGPDSRKICFFVDKSSSFSSHKQWFVYDLTTQDAKAVDLGPRQTAFLLWGRDAQRLYFSQKHSAHDQGESGYILNWFEIPLSSGKILSRTGIFSETLDVTDDELAKEGINIYWPDRRLRFESCPPFRHNMSAVSSTGRRIFVNKKQQLCYQSSYGVRYCLFGLARLDDYLAFPPKGREKELFLQDARWLPSEKYVLLRHYTHGLLVMQPLTRRVGILVSGDVGLFGAYDK